MNWAEVCALHPGCWLLIEALAAHSERGRRIPDRLAVLGVCKDGGAAFARYRELHRQHPDREVYFVHTSNAQLDIEERAWIGIRMGHAPHPA